MLHQWPAPQSCHPLPCFRALVPEFLSRRLEPTPVQKSDQRAHSAPALEACASFLVLFLPWKLT